MIREYSEAEISGVEPRVLSFSIQDWLIASAFAAVNAAFYKMAVKFGLALASTYYWYPSVLLAALTGFCLVILTRCRHDMISGRFAFRIETPRTLWRKTKYSLGIQLGMSILALSYTLSLQTISQKDDFNFILVIAIWLGFPLGVAAATAHLARLGISFRANAVVYGGRTFPLIMRRCCSAGLDFYMVSLDSGMELHLSSNALTGQLYVQTRAHDEKHHPRDD